MRYIIAIVIVLLSGCESSRDKAFADAEKTQATGTQHTEAKQAPVQATLPLSSNLDAFEFLGCSGDWTDEKIQPQAWRAEKKGKTTFLIKHPADCGYTIGSDPKAKIMGSSIDFSYSMSNDDGSLAACYCEYWASFELKSSPDTVTKVSINGTDAELMSGLTER